MHKTLKTILAVLFAVLYTSGVFASASVDQIKARLELIEGVRLVRDGDSLLFKGEIKNPEDRPGFNRVVSDYPEILNRVEYTPKAIDKDVMDALSIELEAYPRVRLENSPYGPRLSGRVYSQQTKLEIKQIVAVYLPEFIFAIKVREPEISVNFSVLQVAKNTDILDKGFTSFVNAKPTPLMPITKHLMPDISHSTLLTAIVDNNPSKLLYSRHIEIKPDQTSFVKAKTDQTRDLAFSLQVHPYETRVISTKIIAFINNLSGKGRAYKSFEVIAPSGSSVAVSGLLELFAKLKDQGVFMLPTLRSFFENERLDPNYQLIVICTAAFD